MTDQDHIPDIPTKASMYMRRRDWDGLLKQKGYKKMAAELLQDLYDHQSAGLLTDSEINMAVMRANLLSQGIDLEWE